MSPADGDIAARRVGAMLRLEDPDGHPLEVFCRAALEHRPSVSPTGPCSSPATWAWATWSRPARTRRSRGTPNWVDLQTTDQAAAKAFYSGLFGWTYDDQPMPQGQVYAGRMAFVIDPAGAPVALWQANQHIGATLVAEPGTVCWNELVTTDPGVTRFYSDVLGLTATTEDMGGGMSYTVFQAAGQPVGGTTPPRAPGVPNHWHVYFAVDDADAAAAKAAELGGTVVVPPFDIPVGRISVISDPQGTVFSIIKPVPRPA